MSVLEQISQMKKQGIPTRQIIDDLKSQGYSPKQINEAFSQSEIKSELEKNPTDSVQDYSQQYPNPQTQNPYPDMQLSIESTEPIPQEDQSSYDYGYQQPDQSQEQNQELQESQQYPQSQEFPSSQNQDYRNYPVYSPQQPFDFETITDLTTQIIEEKTKELKKEISLFSKFRKQVSEEIKELENKITRIENNLNELQISIIRKIGNYGENINNISQELKATQESFSKILNPLTDNLREMEKSKGPEKVKKGSQPKNSFENYLR